jgi:serine/threonine protein kinase
VVIKHLRIGTKDEFDNIFKVGNYNRLMRCSCLLSTKQLCREVLIWKRLSHPNVLPLLGVSVSKNSQYFRIISEWMPNGNVMEYIKSNPQTNRLRLVSPTVHFL